ncbi:DsbA family protein [Clostridium sp.]|uniref:DsbA family protein n=1 Tax=Clostridium sp. TaxID=1506 RepID=UPI002613109E|nr:DsbA family protein [Clostridium sp.]
MPIDGSLWFNNPVKSSFIPSRVFKVIQQIDEHLALVFLRKAREAVFAFDKNIAEDEVLIEIINTLGLDGKEIVKESSLTKSQQLLEEDFAFATQLGVRGFPTIIMVNKENKAVKIVGARSFDYYLSALKQILNDNKELKPASVPKLSEFLEKSNLLFSREIEEMYGLNQTEVKGFIQENLSTSDYEVKEILGELYIEKRV